MPSVKSIDDIKSSLLRPSLTSHFYVEFALPGTGGSTSEFSEKLKTAGINFNVNKQDTLNLLCAEASLPGSSVATLEINNDRTGVTERHAHRRFFDDRIDFTFYVDVENYLPILFFETWMEYISGAGTTDDNPRSAKEYVYRMNYADNYTADKGLKVLKFEKDYDDQTNDIKGTMGSRSYKIRNGTGRSLTYEFIRSYPKAITSMPVTYDASSLLKCSVQMTYVRYVHSMGAGKPRGTNWNPFTMSQFNTGGIGNLGAAAGQVIAGKIMSKPEVQDALQGANQVLGALSNFGY